MHGEEPYSKKANRRHAQAHANIGAIAGPNSSPATTGAKDMHAFYAAIMERCMAVTSSMAAKFIFFPPSLPSYMPEVDEE